VDKVIDKCASMQVSVFNHFGLVLLINNFYQFYVGCSYSLFQCFEFLFMYLVS
jgi:hypothetical protein